ncbi:MAG: glutathione S-transferase family protein [Gammaproteobacteria bacterium]|nr:glutathione S-transferase family protein [Gammaproteobacteria bacterium]
MKPKLISFKLCPFVQKATLTLLHKGIDYDIEYIDLENPPLWFTKISPPGKVPVLKIDDQALFESSVIVEFLDEAFGKPLHPADPLTKAQNRSWMEFGNECLKNCFDLIVAPDETEFSVQQEAMQSKLDRLELQLTGKAYFNGDEISLVDLSFTPFFQRLEYLNAVTPGLIDASRHPRVTRWSDNLLSQQSVAASTVAEIKQIYTGMMKMRNGYLSTLMH